MSGVRYLKLTETEVRRANLNNPREYRNQVNLAQMIARFVEPMPLDDLARIATDATHLALTRSMDPATLQQMQRDRDTLEVLRSAQKQLKQIALRYGE